MNQFSGSVKITNKSQADVDGWWEWFLLASHRILAGQPWMITDVVPFEKSRVKPAPTNQWPQSPDFGRNGGSSVKGLGTS